MPQDGAPPAGQNRIEFWAKLFEQLDKIFSFACKIFTAVATTIWLLFGWLREQVLNWPQDQLFLIGVGAFVIAGVSTYLALRFRQHGPKCLLAAVVAGLAFSFVGLLYYLSPPTPAWERLVAFDIAAGKTPSNDLPIATMREVLTGRNDRFPGGETYRKQLEGARGTESPIEQWAGYYAPEVYRSTLPKEVTIRERKNQSADGYSVGVFLFKWRTKGDKVIFKDPEPFGFESLNQSVAIETKLEPGERSAMLVFVYPLSLDSSKVLPDKMSEIIDIKN